MAADDGTRERGWNEGRFHGANASCFGQVHAFVIAAKQNERHLLVNQLTHLGVVGFLTWQARHRKLAGHAHLGFQKLANTSGIGVGGHHREGGGGKEVLGY